MARRKTLRDLLAQFAPRTQKAFVESISRIVSDVVLKELEDAIRRGDTAAVLDMLEIDRGYFSPLDKALREVRDEAGDFVFDEFRRAARSQGAAVSGFFDSTNLRAARIGVASSELVQNIRVDTRNIIAQIISDNVRDGVNTKRIALDLVGRINRLTGQREGGVIGLLPDEARMAYEMRRGLADGDPEQMRRYLRSVRGSRYMDKRGINRVAKALEQGKSLTAEDADMLINRWRNGALLRRGDRVARTELLSTLGAAQHEGIEQMIESGKISRDAVTLTWSAADDSATRASHAALDGKTADANGIFVSPVTGAQMRYPGDRELGAGPGDVINCRCSMIPSFDFISGLRDRLSSDELAQARALIEAEA